MIFFKLFSKLLQLALLGLLLKHRIGCTLVLDSCRIGCLVCSLHHGKPNNTSATLMVFLPLTSSFIRGVDSYTALALVFLIHPFLPLLLSALCCSTTSFQSTKQSCFLHLSARDRIKSLSQRLM